MYIIKESEINIIKNSIIIKQDREFEFKDKFSSISCSFLVLIHKFISKIYFAINKCIKENKKLLICLNSKNKFNEFQLSFYISCFLFYFNNYSIEKILGIFNEISNIKILDNEDKKPYMNLKKYLKGFKTGIDMKWYNYNLFNEKMTYQLTLTKEGNFTWIIKNSISAFCSPIYENSKFYISLLKSKKIQSIIRLNNDLYNKELFLKNGISHFTYEFEDGTFPEENLIKEIINDLKIIRFPIAIHCKAGLGRTGTIIAILINHLYNIKMENVISWIRICRGGSINDLQHEKLLEYENKKLELLKEKNIFNKHTLKLNNKKNILKNFKFNEINCIEPKLINKLNKFSFKNKKYTENKNHIFKNFNKEEHLIENKYLKKNNFLNKNYKSNVILSLK